MNPGAYRVALIIAGIALGAFVIGFAVLGILAGCAPPPLPPEEPIQMTVHCASRDGG